MPFPSTLEELKQQGYTFDQHRACKGKSCTATLEIWRTPKGKYMPFDVDGSGNVQPHWANCPDHEDFR
jgi:hypothetical protein